MISGNGWPLEAINLLWDRKPGERQSLETGVGKNEHTPSDMRRTKVRSRELNSGCVVASSCQTITHFGFPLRVAGGLLHDNPFCRQLEGNTEHGGPQGRTIAVAMDGRADARTLTGRPTDKQARAPRHSAEGSHVIVNGDPRELGSQESSSLGIEFTKSNCGDAGRFEPKCMASNTREKIERIHSLRSSDEPATVMVVTPAYPS